MSSHYARFGFVPPLASFAAFFALSTTSFLRGQEITIVSPSEFANKEGEGQSADACCPFSFRYQQLFPADDFSSLPDGQGLLASIAWRPDGNAVTGPRSTNLGHTVVRVSTTRSNALEDVLDANVTSEPVTVVDGTVRLQTADLGPDGGPKEFDYVVRFDTPFFYDTAQGNLLFDWDLTEGFAAPVHLSDGFSELTDPAMARVRFATPVDAETGFFVGGFVQQFSFVPEPSSTALTCMGLLTCFLVLRRRNAPLKSSLLPVVAYAVLLLLWPHRLRAQQPPDLAGPFTVGHQMIDAVDADRNNRPLATLIWYPVDAEDAAGAEPLRYFQHYSGGRWWYESPFIGGVMDASASSSGPFPLIALGHGHGGFPQQLAMLSESLASHGFVVVAPRFTGDAWGTPTLALPHGTQAQDIAFVTELITQKTDSEGDVLYGKVDVNTLGLGGYSGGAVARLAPTRVPPKAIVAIDINVDVADDVPVLGTGDASGQFPGSRSGGISYGLDLDNVHHWSFGTNGCQYRDKLTEANAPPEVLGTVPSDSFWEGCASESRPIDEVQTLVSQQAVSFFKLHLEDDATYQGSLWPSFAELSYDLVVFAELPGGGTGSIDLLLTDPSGRRLGLDLGSGGVVNEIGDSARLRGAGSRRQSFIIAAEEILPGDYLITGVGAKSLSEVRDFEIAYQVQGDRGEDLLSVREVIAAGQIGAGSPVETGFSIVPEPSTNLVVLCCLILLLRRCSRSVQSA